MVSASKRPGDGAGRGGRAGTLRDSLFILDAIHARDGGPKLETVITDPASYSDIVFDLFATCGYQFSPRIADISDARPWRTNTAAGAGPAAAARPVQRRRDQQRRGRVAAGPIQVKCGPAGGISYASGRTALFSPGIGANAGRPWFSGRRRACPSLCAEPSGRGTVVTHLALVVCRRPVKRPRSPRSWTRIRSFDRARTTRASFPPRIRAMPPVSMNRPLLSRGCRAGFHGRRVRSAVAALASRPRVRSGDSARGGTIQHGADHAQRRPITSRCQGPTNWVPARRRRA
ncbi:Tn3 family transposase [Streptomyces smaragdinus]|uniref:Tn3 family transposase n=1 Tax=Streptomyces smaragdinus TaxID=2585196 RepID=UPI001295DFCC